MMKRLWEEKPMRIIASELEISEGKARRYFHRGMFQIQKAAGTQTKYIPPYQILVRIRSDRHQNPAAPLNPHGTHVHDMNQRNGIFYVELF